MSAVVIAVHGDRCAVETDRGYVGLEALGSGVPDPGDRLVGLAFHPGTQVIRNATRGGEFRAMVDDLDMTRPAVLAWLRGA